MLPAAERPVRTLDEVGAADAADRVVTFTGRALGSAIRLLVREPAGRDDAADRAAAAWADVLDELAAVDLALSRFREDSEVTRLNRRAGSGSTAYVSRRLRIALATCHRAGAVTGGRFDAGMADVLERIGEPGASLAPSPDPGGAADTGRRSSETGWPVRVPPAAIDLGGIGKGLAIRWASERAILRLPQDAGLLLDAGGDVVAAGQPPPGGWSVGIEDPAAADPAVAEPLAVLALDGGAVATSSVRVRHWAGSDGRAVHHLLDPRTREPARTGLIAVTVVAPDPAWAEVWTKALFLAGREEIGAEARARGLAAWWVDAGGHLGMTPEARLRTAWAAEARIG